MEARAFWESVLEKSAAQKSLHAQYLASLADLRSQIEAHEARIQRISGSDSRLHEIVDKYEQRMLLPQLALLHHVSSSFVSALHIPAIKASIFLVNIIFVFQ
jgi:hypothetical protein